MGLISVDPALLSDAAARLRAMAGVLEELSASLGVDVGTALASDLVGQAQSRLRDSASALAEQAGAMEGTASAFAAEGGAGLVAAAGGSAAVCCGIVLTAVSPAVTGPTLETGTTSAPLEAAPAAASAAWGAPQASIPDTVDPGDWLAPMSTDTTSGAGYGLDASSWLSPMADPGPVNTGYGLDASSWLSPMADPGLGNASTVDPHAWLQGTSGGQAGGTSYPGLDRLQDKYGASSLVATQGRDLVSGLVGEIGVENELGADPNNLVRVVPSLIGGGLL